MKAFVLAAGKGERLRPVTAHTPKPLLPVADVPAIVYTLLQLRRAGITQAVVNAHHLAPALESFLRAHDFGYEIIISYEPELLGTGGGLMNARRYFDEPFFLLNADIIADYDLSTLSAAYDGRCRMLLRRQAEIAAVAPVAVEGEMVLDLRRELHGLDSPLHYCGTALLDPQIFELLELRPGCIVDMAYLPLAREGRLCWQEYSGLWHDAGKPYQLYQAGMSAAAHDWQGLFNQSGFALALHSRQACLGDCVLRDTLVSAGASVGDGALLEQCLLLPGAQVEAKEQVSRVLFDRDGGRICF